MRLLRVGSERMAATVVAPLPADPLAGVKRKSPIAGPNPSTRAKSARFAATDPVSVPTPSLAPTGRRPGRASNEVVVYSRVVPMSDITAEAGRLSPGDVVFVDRQPIGALTERPRLTNAVLGLTSGGATMARLVGLDRLNELLHGDAPASIGWMVGVNVLVGGSGGLRPEDVVFARKPSDPAATATSAPDPVFRLEVLDRYRLDGVVMSNDDTLSTSSMGTRDAALFNIAIAGCCRAVNNGFLKYTTGLAAETALHEHQYARGSSAGGQLLGSTVGRPGQAGAAWLGGHQRDLVAQMTGTFHNHPAQMFGRDVAVSDRLYLGLRTFELNRVQLAALQRPDGSLYYAGGNVPSDAVAYFYQVMPFAASKVHALEAVDGAVEAATKAGEDVAAARARVVAAFAQHAPSHVADQRGSWDQQPFDAVRAEDVRQMACAWHVGRVLDTKAMRTALYDSAMPDTSVAVAAHLHLELLRLSRIAGGSSGAAQQTSDRGVTSYQSNAFDGSGKQTVDAANATRQTRLAVDEANAVLPSMLSVSPLLGKGLREPGKSLGLNLAPATADGGAAAPVAPGVAAAAWRVLGEALRLDTGNKAVAVARKKQDEYEYDASKKRLRAVSQQALTKMLLRLVGKKTAASLPLVRRAARALRLVPKDLPGATNAQKTTDYKTALDRLLGVIDDLDDRSGVITRDAFLRWAEGGRVLANGQSLASLLGDAVAPTLAPALEAAWLPLARLDPDDAQPADAHDAELLRVGAMPDAALAALLATPPAAAAAASSSSSSSAAASGDAASSAAPIVAAALAAAVEARQAPAAAAAAQAPQAPPPPQRPARATPGGAARRPPPSTTAPEAAAATPLSHAAPPAPARRREARGTSSSSASVVGSVFESLFSSDGPADGDAGMPASPTRSDGSNEGPRTFKKRAGK